MKINFGKINTKTHLVKETLMGLQIWMKKLANLSLSMLVLNSRDWYEILWLPPKFAP